MTPTTPSVLVTEFSVIGTLWRREMLRLVKEPSRWLGVVLQPLLFWFVIGSGMTGKYPTGGAEDADYLNYFFPGIMVMIVLFTAIFATISVIEDRQSGFLQGVLVAPASRTSMVLGKVAGVTTLALIQAGLFLVIAPWAGYSFSGISWHLLVFVVITTCIGFTAVGFTLAWLLNSTMGYHGIMSVVLIPLWVVSGAMFPVDHGWLEWVAAANPLSYSVSGARAALHGGVDVGMHQSITLSCSVLLAFAILSTLLAARVCRGGRRQSA